jgi:hypothetical protein
MNERRWVVTVICTVPLAGMSTIISVRESHWKQPITGFIDVLAGISNTKSSHWDSVILAKVRELYAAMYGVIWLDIEHQRHSWLRWHPLVVTKNSRILNDVDATWVDHNFNLVGACSTRPPEGWPYIVGFTRRWTVVVENLLSTLRHFYCAIRHKMLDKAFSTVTPDIIALYVKQVLSNPSMIGEAIERRILCT